MTHQEIRTIEHKGVKVSFKIDYDEGTATLVEKYQDKWLAKQYLFKGRGLEYMNSWQNVLEAMQVAVKECKKSLEADLRERSRLQEEEILRAVSFIDASTKDTHAGSIKAKKK